MDIIQYFESVRQAFYDDDTDKAESLMQEYGDQEVKMKDVEKLVAHVFGTMASFQIAMEEKDQIHFDMIVNALEDSKALNSEQVAHLKDLDNQLNEALEKEEK